MTSVADEQLDPAPGASDLREHTEHGRERKQQLVVAASELFAARGYAATRVSDICRRAGVTKSLFYWYFATKRDLFAELVHSMRIGLRRAQAAAMDPAASALDRIGTATEASVRFMAEHAEYFALIDVERREHDVADVLAEGADVYRDDVRQLIVEGQRAGDIVDGDPDLLTLGVLGAVSTFSAAYRSGRIAPTTTVEELAGFVERWVTSALS